METQKFVCADCGKHTDMGETSQYSRKLPHLLCSECFIDLKQGNYSTETVAEREERQRKKETTEDRLLKEIFGQKDDRGTRKGSSLANISHLDKMRKKDARRRKEVA